MYFPSEEAILVVSAMLVLIVITAVSWATSFYRFASAKARIAYLRVLAVLALLQTQVLIAAYHAFAENVLSAVGVKRMGAATAMNRGVTFIVEVIFLTLGLYFAAFLLPGALTAIATTALTSVNAGVITIFQVVVPFTAVATLILLLIGVVREAIGL